MEKAGVVKYVRIMKKLFVIFSVIAVPAIMVCFVFMFSRYAAFYFISPALIVFYLIVYGLYAMRVSMGAVLEVHVTKEVVHIRTKRKTFTYDAQNGCVDMKVYKNKFVGTFQTQNSRDKFTFYRRVLFSKYSEEQFTERDIEHFYPRIHEKL